MDPKLGERESIGTIEGVSYFTLVPCKLEVAGKGVAELQMESSMSPDSTTGPRWRKSDI